METVAVRVLYIVSGVFFCGGSVVGEVLAVARRRMEILEGLRVVERGMRRDTARVVRVSMVIWM